MQKNTITNLDFPLLAEKNNLISNYYLNLPDLHFFQKCNQQYRINRGVYNMIDDWFFEYGIVQIAHRRIFILEFLDFAYEENKNNSNKFLKFGHGGLMKKLNKFIKYHESGDLRTKPVEKAEEVSVSRGSTDKTSGKIRGNVRKQEFYGQNR